MKRAMSQSKRIALEKIRNSNFERKIILQGPVLWRHLFFGIRTL